MRKWTLLTLFAAIVGEKVAADWFVGCCPLLVPFAILSFGLVILGLLGVFGALSFTILLDLVPAISRLALIFGSTIVSIQGLDLYGVLDGGH